MTRAMGVRVATGVLLGWVLWGFGRGMLPCLQEGACDRGMPFWYIEAAFESQEACERKRAVLAHAIKDLNVMLKHSAEAQAQATGGMMDREFYCLPAGASPR